MVDDLMKKYPNDLKLVIKNFPLFMQATKAAKHALAAISKGNIMKCIKKSWKTSVN